MKRKSGSRGRVENDSLGSVGNTLGLLDDNHEAIHIC
jgi:hypothetical protein